MAAITDFLSSWLGMGIMAVLLVALVGVMIVLRNKRSDDE